MYMPKVTPPFHKSKVLKTFFAQFSDKNPNLRSKHSTRHLNTEHLQLLSTDINSNSRAGNTKQFLFPALKTDFVRR